MSFRSIFKTTGIAVLLFIQMGHAAMHSDHFAFGVAEHFAGARVYELIMTPGVGDEDAVRGLLDQAPVFGFALAYADVSLFAFGNVLHRADHAHALACRVAHNESAVENVGKRTVRTQKAVIVRPRISTAVDDSVNTPKDAVAVVGVDPGGPGREIRFNVFAPETVSTKEIGVPPDRVVHQVPVPDNVVGGAHNDLETLLAQAKRFLSLLALGYVYGHAADRTLCRWHR